MQVQSVVTGADVQCKMRRTNQRLILRRSSVAYSHRVKNIIYEITNY